MLLERAKRWVSRLTCCCLLLGFSSEVLAQRAYVSGKPIAVYDTSGAIPAALGNIDIDYFVEDLAVSPDGGTLYAVAAQGNTGYLLAINPRATDASSNPPAAIVGKVGIGSAPFGGMALSADGKTVYVANYGEGSVYIIDVGVAPKVTADIGLCAGTDGIALSPDGKTAYVACRSAGAIGIIGTTGPSATTLPVQSGGSQLAIAQNILYMTYPGNGRIDAVDAGISIALPSAPEGIAVSPSGKTLYATLFRGMGVVGGFVPIDITTPSGTVGTPINVGLNPMGVTLAADGKYAYVANYDPASGASGGSVSVVDTTAASVIATLTAGVNPTMVALGAAAPPLAPSATTLTLDPSSAMIGQTVTANVKITFPLLGITNAPGVPSGSVFVTDGSVSCTATLSPGSGPVGVGSCPLSFASAGTHTLTASYSGDVLYGASSGTADETVLPVGLTMAFAPPTIPEGATAMLRVTLSNVGSSDVLVPSLKVTAPANLTGLSTVSNDCGGSVGLTPTQVILSSGFIGLSSTCTIVVGTTSTMPAIYTFTIAAGDFQTSAGNNASAISTDLAVVAPISPTLAISFTPSSIAAGGASTLTLTLNNANTTPLLLTSLSDTLPSGVVIADPVSATTNCPNAAVFASPGGASLDVSNGTAGLVTSTIPAQGSCTASVAVTSRTPGSYTNTIPAGALQTQTTSPPDSSFVGIMDDSVTAIHATLTVSATTPIPTLITLSATPNPAILSQSVTVNASVAPVSVVPAGTGSPSGTITVSEGALTCTITLTASTGGSAGSCTLSFSTSGIHTLQASYSGDASFAASNASPYNLTVNPAPPIATTTSVAASPNPASVGQSVSASVSVVGGTTPTALSKALTATAAATPTGTVSIGDGTTSCMASLANGHGSCTLIFAAPGTRGLTATYGGDDNYAASSATVNEVVNAVIPPIASAVPAPTLDLRGLLVLLLAVCAIGTLTRHWRPR